MPELVLIFPDESHEREVMDYAAEHHAYFENKMSGSGGLHKMATFTEWLIKLQNDRIYNEDIPERVPTTTYLAVRSKDNRIVGMVQVRHFLNEYLLNVDGNIGYGVRPTERLRGYATEILSLALDICREMKMDKVLVTHNRLNVASERVILKNNGQYESDFLEDNGNTVKRYWINLRH